MLFPVIERIAPKLPRFAEIIGRNAGNGNRETLAVKLEQLLVRPNVRAVERDKYRRVPNNGNMLFIGVCLERAPLLLEFILQEDFFFNRAGKRRLPFFEGTRVAPAQSLREGIPARAFVIAAQSFLRYFRIFKLRGKRGEAFACFVLAFLPEMCF